MQDELRDASLLVFANKQDLPNAMNAAEITDKLGLHNLRGRNWWVLAGVEGARSARQKLQVDQHGRPLWLKPVICKIIKKMQVFMQIMGCFFSLFA